MNKITQKPLFFTLWLCLAPTLESQGADSFSPFKVVDGPTINCSYLYSSAQMGRTPRPLEKVKDLKIMTLNHNDFFVNPPKGEPRRNKQGDIEPFVPKPTWEREALAKYTRSADPDIIVGTEFDDVATAQQYAREYLNDDYIVYGHEGNDPRGIDIVTFVKRDLPFDVSFESNINDRVVRENGQSAPLFSRDNPVLIFRPAGSPPGTPPVFIVRGIHNKSQRRSDGDVVDQSLLRGAQITHSLKGMEEDEQRFYPDVPVFSGGDWNEDRDRGYNMVKAKKEFPDMPDAVDASPKVEGPSGTHAYPPGRGKPMQFSRLDGANVSEGAAKYLTDVQNLGFVGPEGRTDKVPKDYDDRENNFATDHTGVLFKFDFDSLYKGYQKRVGNGAAAPRSPANKPL